MVDSITCLHVNHLNALVEDFDDSLAHFRDLYGAQFLLDKPESEYCLIAIGTVIFELFVPQNFLLHARLGPNYNGLEYQVPDVGEARKALQSRGIRIVGDVEVAFYTHPADTFGVGFEFYHRNFHTDGIPNGYLEPIKPIDYWRDEHPLGCTGLKRYSLVVGDVGAATKFFQDFMGATILYEEPVPRLVLESSVSIWPIPSQSSSRRSRTESSSAISPGTETACVPPFSGYEGSNRRSPT